MRFPPAPCPCLGVLLLTLRQCQGCSLYHTVAAQTHVFISSLAVCHCAGYFWDWISASWSQLFGESMAGRGRKEHLLTRAESLGFSNCLNLFNLFERSVFLCSATVLQV